MVTPAPRLSPARVTLVGGLATVVGQLPVFLTGAMAVQITDDLLFGAAALGVAVAMFRVAGAVTSHYLGGLVDRVGAVASLRLAALVSLLASVGIAATATSWLALVAWLMFGATSNVLAQPAANRLLVRTIPPARQGMAFGVKQSAPPVASMLAGLSVPVIALTVGWRWAYLLGALLALLVIVGAGRRPPPPERVTGFRSVRPKLRDRGTVLLLAVALGLSTTASTPVAAFFVDASVRGGSSPELAGSLLGLASAAAVATRLVGGVVADRLRGGHLLLCAAMLMVGSTGLLLLASGVPAAMGFGVVVALMGTWGFNGVFVYSLMQAYPDAPGAATGATMPGGLIGGILGPVVFGVLAERVSYAAAWSYTFVAAIIAVGAFVVAAARLREQVLPGR